MIYLGAICSLSFFNNALEKAEVERFYITALHLGHCAQTTHTIQELVINPENGSYSTKKTTVFLKSGLQFGKPSITLSQNINGKTSFAHNKIVFYPSGIISAGTVYFTRTDSSRMYAISSAVSSISFLRKYQYDGSWKQYS